MIFHKVTKISSEKRKGFSTKVCNLIWKNIETLTYLNLKVESINLLGKYLQILEVGKDLRTQKAISIKDK